LEIFVNPSESEPQPRHDRLALLYRVSQNFNSSLDLDQVLNLVIDEVIAATRAERGFLMLSDEEGKLVFQAARGLDQHTINQPEAQVSQSVIQRVAQDGKALLTSNAQDENWLSDRQSVIFLGLRSVLCVPLQIKGANRGVIYVDNRVQSGIFSNDDLELLTAIAASAAIAIENARLFQVAVEKGRLERELQLAREVQSSLLPESLPQIQGWDIAAQWKPAREVAGDFYDLIKVDPDQLSVIIADVSDKGMPAALYMALTRSILRACMLDSPLPANGIAKTNELICADTAFGMFVTLFYARINTQSGEIQYVNAGHNPPLHYQAKDNQLVKLTRTGMALGVEETSDYGQRVTRINPGDLLFMYTDGVTEATNAKEEEYGVGRLESVLKECHGQHAAEVLAIVQKSIQDFIGPAPQFDDITMVAIKRSE
jgi:phosphoserine phosphatase RsbU/P